MCEGRKLQRNKFSIQKINLEQFLVINKQLNEKKTISLFMAGCAVVSQGLGLVCSQGLQCF